MNAIALWENVSSVAILVAEGDPDKLYEEAESSWLEVDFAVELTLEDGSVIYLNAAGGNGGHYGAALTIDSKIRIHH